MKHQDGRRLLGVCESASRGEKEVMQKKTLRKSKKVNNSGRDFIGSSQDASSLWPDDVNALYLL